MRKAATLQTRMFRCPPLQGGILATGLLMATMLPLTSSAAQTSAPAQAVPAQPHTVKPRAHHKKQEPAAVPVAETPAPPPMPHWPVNEKPNPASVVWDANGLRINASNSSLQQILTQVATETGTKVEGPIPDQRIYGEFGPGQAREILTQLLQGSGYNVLLAGDLGQGTPREIVLSPRKAGNTPANNAAGQPQPDQDDDVPDQPEEQPQPAMQNPQMPNRPGFGPNGPVRTPQQVIEEMQQQQQQQANPPTTPQ